MAQKGNKLGSHVNMPTAPGTRYICAKKNKSQMSSLPTVKNLPYTSLITAAEAIIQNKEFVSFLHNKKSILTSNDDILSWTFYFFLQIC